MYKTLSMGALAALTVLSIGCSGSGDDSLDHELARHSIDNSSRWAAVVDLEDVLGWDGQQDTNFLRTVK